MVTDWISKEKLLDPAAIEQQFRNLGPLDNSGQPAAPNFDLNQPPKF